MIYDLIDNIGQYRGLHPNLDLAIDVIAQKEYATKEPGKYAVSGTDVFYFIQENQLANGGHRFEYHRKYADLHFLLSGEEIISYGYDNGDELESFKEADDIGFVTASRQLDLPINQRYFAFFQPGETHLPNQDAGVGNQVKKCVFKILIDD